MFCRFAKAFKPWVHISLRPKEIWIASFLLTSKLAFASHRLEKFIACLHLGNAIAAKFLYEGTC